MTRAACRGLAFATALLAAVASAWARAAVPVVATTADLGSIARSIGGARVSVQSLVPPSVDAEEYQPRPNDLARLREARLVLRVGADYDLWLDRLVARASRPELQRGGTAHLDCSGAIALLDVRGVQVGPAGGHAHGAGNPHYWLDPSNAVIIAALVAEALARTDPANAAPYAEGLRAFREKIEARLPQWEAALAPLRGRPLVSHHGTWSYFARRFRLNFIATIEPRPGIPPTAAHLASLLATMKAQGVATIVRQPHEPARSAEFLAARSGARIVLLASSVGAVPEAADYVSLIDYNVAALSARR